MRSSSVSAGTTMIPPPKPQQGAEHAGGRTEMEKVTSVNCKRRPSRLSYRGLRFGGQSGTAEKDKNAKARHRSPLSRTRGRGLGRGVGGADRQTSASSRPRANRPSPQPSPRRTGARELGDRQSCVCRRHIRVKPPGGTSRKWIGAMSAHDSSAGLCGARKTKPAGKGKVV